MILTSSLHHQNPSQQCIWNLANWSYQRTFLKWTKWHSKKKLLEKKSSSLEMNKKYKFASEWQSVEDDPSFNNLENALTPT
jgi:hypothetical protein